MELLGRHTRHLYEQLHQLEAAPVQRSFGDEVDPGTGQPTKVQASLSLVIVEHDPAIRVII